MTVYVVAQLSFVDRAAYERYRQRFMGVMNRYRGRLLASDEHPTVLEGAWNRDKIVLMSFPDEQSFSEWSNSPEYQEILKDRKAGATAVVLLVHGIPEKT
jgi:uncharacterized protein (DUF1330 family)